MAVYKYTLKKYFKAKSTWIILILGFIIAGMLGGILPWSLYDPTKDSDASGYSRLLIGSVAGITSMMAIFTTIFASYKAATMYKDEVEDGTFLVLLSKPQSRFKIIMYKWLALQTVICFFLLVVVSSYGVFNVVNDNFPSNAPSGIKSMSSQMWGIMGTMFGVLLVMSLIFSSISLLISTKTSTSATIGIGIALGVIVPITGLLQTFTQGTEHEKISNGSFELTHATLANSLGNGLGTESLNQSMNELYNTLKGDDGLLNMAIKTNEGDSYKIWSLIDLNYQIGQLASYATEKVITSEYRDIIAATAGNNRGGSPFAVNSRNIVASKNDFGKLISNDKIAAKTEFESKIDDIFQKATTFSQNLNSVLDIINLAATSNGQSIDLEKEIEDVDYGKQVEIKNQNGDILISSNLGSFKSFWQSNKELSNKMDVTSEPGHVLTQILNKDYIATFLRENITGGIPKAENVTIGGVTIPDNTTDAEIIANMKKLIDSSNSGSYINMVSQKDYATKENILIFYLVIAFTLVPISILIVKKQDFR